MLRTLAPISHDRRVPRLVRLVIGIVGSLTLLTSIVLFLQPGFMISTWPWQLTPLTARVMGALFALTGVGELAIALDVRWSAARIALQSQMIGIAAIALAMVFSWSNFHQANPSDVGLPCEHPFPVDCKPTPLSLDGDARQSDRESSVIASSGVCYDPTLAQ